jgi:hypothetical protein
VTSILDRFTIAGIASVGLCAAAVTLSAPAAAVGFLTGGGYACAESAGGAAAPVAAGAPCAAAFVPAAAPVFPAALPGPVPVVPAAPVIPVIPAAPVVPVVPAAAPVVPVAAAPVAAAPVAEMNGFAGKGDPVAPAPSGSGPANGVPILPGPQG